MIVHDTDSGETHIFPRITKIRVFASGDVAMADIRGGGVEDEEASPKKQGKRGGKKGKRACKECGELGHNAKTCQNRKSPLDEGMGTLAEESNDE